MRCPSGRLLLAAKFQLPRPCEIKARRPSVWLWLTSSLAPLLASSLRFFQLGPTFLSRLFLAQRSSCTRCDSVLLSSGYILWVHQSWLFCKNTNWYVCRWERHVFLPETICFPNCVFCVCFAYKSIFIAYICCTCKCGSVFARTRPRGPRPGSEGDGLELGLARPAARRSIKCALAPERPRSNRVGAF